MRDRVLLDAKLRPDLLAIVDLIPPRSSVLDLGCADGALLSYLSEHRQVKGRGIELSEAGVIASVRRGISVRQGNLQEGLADYPDKSFDFVILSQTLRYLNDPAMILAEMLRVGEEAIVSFPNWGHWRSRLELMFKGRIPQPPEQAQAWSEPPRWQAFTVADFGDFCHAQGFHIRQQVYLSGKRSGHWWSNLMAKTAIFVLKFQD